ncbi:SDR family NAD(P)-dependent oxidoreductase [Streptomyces sp. NPDC002763]|uniref:SDR family NAD(P)-dependent oxidoreductase n=1 Tax=Streptomyces sp. NPDC002763 TaxID=3154427 RepID=UPI003318374A
MKSILIAGGNSGIGRHVAAELVSQGHRVVILGRDQRKGEETLASFGDTAEHTSFHAVDLSTHDGVRDAAKRVLQENDYFDALVHTTGVMTSEDLRTADGLHQVFAVNYLSRYHLTQLLMPALRSGENGRVLMMTAHIPPTTKTSFEKFPDFRPFDFLQARKPIQLANHYYAAHLTGVEPKIRAGVINAGVVKTDLLRMQPRLMKVTATVIATLFAGSVEKSAHNVIHASLRDDWADAQYWGKPGAFEEQTRIEVEPCEVQRVMAISRELTGA